MTTNLGPGASSADAWWASLPLKRREQICRWVRNQDSPDDAGEIPGQRAIFDVVDIPISEGTRS